jgi:hypothetical protein
MITMGTWHPQTRRGDAARRTASLSAARRGIGAMMRRHWWIEIALVIACTVALALLAPDVTPRRARGGAPMRPVATHELPLPIVPLSSR